ncbi:MAG TPA: hypothetical protein VGO93_30000, partial [Candidatus Xenobia bacterium]
DKTVRTETQNQTIYEFDVNLGGEQEYTSGDEPFEIQLPASPAPAALPDNLLGDAIRVVSFLASAHTSPVHWKLRARLEIPWKVNLHQELPITVT